MSRDLVQLADAARAAGEEIDDWIYTATNEPGNAHRLGLDDEETARLAALPEQHKTIRKLWSRNPSATRTAFLLDDDEAEFYRLLATTPPRYPPRATASAPLAFQSYGTDAKRAGDLAANLGELYDALDEERAERVAVAQSALPKHLRKRIANAKHVPMLSTRNRIRRRVATHAFPDAGIVTLGPSLRDLDHWQRRAQTSQDMTERAIARRLHRAPLLERAIAFTLWHLAVSVGDRLGYIGAVTGYSRAMLASLIPARNAKGKPVHEDTISRVLASLGARLGGILTWHQPDPDAVARRGLPGARHYLEDGTITHQAFNLYRFWPCDARGEKMTTSSASTSARARVDLGSGYREELEKQSFRPESASQGAESGGTGPPDG